MELEQFVSHFLSHISIRLEFFVVATNTMGPRAFSIDPSFPPFSPPYFFASSSSSSLFLPQTRGELERNLSDPFFNERRCALMREHVLRPLFPQSSLPYLKHFTRSRLLLEVFIECKNSSLSTFPAPPIQRVDLDGFNLFVNRAARVIHSVVLVASREREREREQLDLQL